MLTLLTVSFAMQAQLFVPMRHPGTDVAVETQLKALCPAPANASGTVLLNREVDAGNRAPFRGAPDDAWTRLGCARVALSYSEVAPREGPAMPLGNSWAQGALDAMLEAVEQHPTQQTAAEVAALLALRELRPHQLARAAAAFMKAIDAGVTAPAVLRGCDEFALRLGRDSVALRCATLGLSAGHDSTWHLIRIARLHFRAADSVDGVQDFVRAAGSARAPEARNELQWHLQWFLTPAEITEYPGIPTEQLGPWVSSRLAARDVRDDQPRGARLAEHFKRLDYVYAHFWTYIPAASARRNLQRATRVATIGVAHNEDGMTRGMTPTGSSGIVARWQTEFDDRGVVWLRLGPPANRYYWGYDFARELWIYQIDGQRNFLQFQDEDFNGNKEATRLVSGVIDPFFCGIDKLRCQVSSYVFSPPPPELVARITAQDQQSTRLGTIADDNSRRDAAHIDVVGQWFRLWNPVDGSPLAITSYAVRQQDLDLGSDSARREGSFTVRLRQYRDAAHSESDTAFVRSVRVPANATTRSFLTGVLVSPGTHDVTTWSLSVSQGSARWGRAFQQNPPPLESGPVVLSDLILGSAGQGLSWDGLDEPVVLGPLGAFARTDPIALFYQVKSTRAIERLSTSISLTCLECGLRLSDTPPRLTFSFDAPMPSGITGVHRGLDVSTLQRGSYQLDIILRNSQGQVILIRSTRLNLD